MSDPRVIRREEIDSVQRGPGVSVASSVTKEVGATEISSGITTFQAGTSNTTHYHNAEESVIVIEGEGILMINGGEPRPAIRRRLHHAGHPSSPDQHRRYPLQDSLVLRHRRSNADAGG